MWAENSIKRWLIWEESSIFKSFSTSSSRHAGVFYVIYTTINEQLIKKPNTLGQQDLNLYERRPNNMVKIKVQNNLTTNTEKVMFLKPVFFLLWKIENSTCFLLFFIT